MIIQASPGGVKQVQQIQQGQISQTQLQQMADSGQQVQVQQEILSNQGESGQLMPSELMASVDQMNEGGVGVINDSLEDGEALQVQGEETVVTSEAHDPQNSGDPQPELIHESRE